jgi:hypothetical protein
VERPAGVLVAAIRDAWSDPPGGPTRPARPAGDAAGDAFERAAQAFHAALDRSHDADYAFEYAAERLAGWLRRSPSSADEERLRVAIGPHASPPADAAPPAAASEPGAGGLRLAAAPPAPAMEVWLRILVCLALEGENEAAAEQLRARYAQDGTLVLDGPPEARRRFDGRLVAAARQVALVEEQTLLVLAGSADA